MIRFMNKRYIEGFKILLIELRQFTLVFYEKVELF